MSSSATEEGHKVQIKLTTKQPAYAVPDTTLNVPIGIKTNELNKLVNNLLKANKSYNKKDVKFDFVVNDEELLPRGSTFEDFINLHKFPTENEFVVEYIEATPSPEPLDCLMHDDWVAAVKTSKSKKWILSGCYDNSIHIWSPKGKHLLLIMGHSAPIKGVDWINDQSDEILTFVSVSQDQTALLWEWDVEKNDAKSLYICRGHERSVNCVSALPSENAFVTGGWDSSLKLWSSDVSVSVRDDEEESASKRRKGENGPHIRIPKSTLKGHRDAVSSVQWLDSNEILSSSMDHTIRIWDAELGGIKHETVTNKSVFHAHYSNLNKLVLSCGADRHIRLYDPRSTSGSIAKRTFSSHKEWVQSVKWCPTNTNLFVSGSYDKCLKLWDIRCGNTPLNDMIGHEDKILCVDFTNPELIISGGADSSLRLFRHNS